MSTTGVETWAVDLKDVAAIYPFQGMEWLLVIIGVVCWLGWHVWCIQWEKAHQQEMIRKYGNPEALQKAVEPD